MYKLTVKNKMSGSPFEGDEPKDEHMYDLVLYKDEKEVECYSFSNKEKDMNYILGRFSIFDVVTVDNAFCEALSQRIENQIVYNLDDLLMTDEDPFTFTIKNGKAVVI